MDENDPEFNAFKRLQDSKKMLNIARYDGDAAAGGRLYLAGVEETVMSQLVRTGMAKVLGEDAIFMAEPQLGISLNKALAAAEDWLADQTEIEEHSA